MKQYYQKETWSIDAITTSVAEPGLVTASCSHHKIMFINKRI